MFSFTVQAADAAGQRASQAFAVSIAASLAITTTSLPNGMVGAAYSATLGAAGGTVPYTWSVISGQLPSGLSLSASGSVSGTPTATGPSSFTAQVRDAAGQTASQALTLSINAALTITTTSLPGGMVGAAYGAALAASGGTSPYTWSVISGQLPARLTFGTAGTLWGMLAAAGSASFTVQVRDAEGRTASRALTLSITAALSITTTSLPNGTVGTVYSATLGASGGTAPYTWSTISGQLPAGLALSASGSISGTPTAANSSSFTVQARDAGGQTASRALTLSIGAALSITTTSLSNGTVGAVYSATLAASGSTSPYTWSVISGQLPAGLTLGTAGTLSGTPTAATSASFTVQVTDAAGQTASRALTLSISAALSITTTSLPGGTVGVTYSTTLGAAGGTAPYTWSVISGQLPAGLSLSASGSVSGTPTAANSSSFTVQVRDAAGQTASQALTLSINAALTITTTSLPGGMLGAAYGATLPASGGTSPYTWSVISGQLPAGLTLGTAGTLSGTPTAASSASFTVQVRDAAGQTTSRALTLSISAALSITTTSLPNGMVGAAYSSTLGAAGGTTPYSWSVSAGQLPGGLTLNTSGTLSGTPMTSGSSSFTVQARDAAGQTASRAPALSISAALSITTTSLPNSMVGAAYSATLEASGGTAPYTWSIISGQLPAGLALTASGSISGTPTAAKSSSFTVQVRDAAGQTASQALNLSINAALSITTTSLTNGTVSTAYGATLAASGGTSPYAWCVISGQLPAGLTLGTAGALSGTPTAATSASFAVQVTDAAGQTASRALTLSISAALSITTTSLPNGTVGVAYSATLGAAGGTAPHSWSIISGQLPAGLTLNSSGTLSGTPTASGSSSFTVQAADAAGQRASQAFTVSIAAGLAITTTSLPNGMVGAAYSATLGAAGGTAPYTWSVISGQLPSGLSLNASGSTSGTPTATGPSSFTAQVRDAAGQTASQAQTLSINAALTITTTSLPGGMVGAAYGTTLAASGGTSPYTWSVISGQLPAGLTLGTAGTLSGTPTASGSSSFTVQVTDAAGQTASRALTISITAGLSITTISLPNGTVGTTYAATLAASGGTAPYSWSILAGQLQSGLALSASGSISGTPSASGTLTVTIQVRDSMGAQTSRAFTVTIVAALTLLTTGLPSGTVGVAYNATTLLASGGTTPYGWSITAGQPPAGLSLSSSGTLSGTPTAAGSSIDTIQVADSAGARASQTYMLVVAAPALAITTASLPNGTVGTAYSATLAASGGTVPYTWTLTAGVMPPGLALAPGGAISGMPTTAASTSFTLKVADSAGHEATQPYTLTIAPASSINVTSTALPYGRVTYPYNTVLSASGGTPPYTWRTTSGSIPAGLSLSTSGIIAGTPTAAGTSNLALTVTDATGTQSTQALSLTIVPTVSVRSGGLLSYPTTVPGPNLLNNGGFEQIGSDNLPVGWSYGLLVPDKTVFHSGTYSYSVVNASQAQFTPNSSQNINLKKGIYSIGAWVKSQNLGQTTPGFGIRICLSAQTRYCSDVIRGTNDWTYVKYAMVEVPQDAAVTFTIECYGKPDGTAWIDDAALWEEQKPINVFMLYPNYRGILFDDQSQTTQFDVTLAVPTGAGLLSDYTLTGTVTDENTAAVVRSTSFTATEHSVVPFDLAGLDRSHSYAVTFTMARANPSAAYTFPAYRITMAPGSTRSAMAVSFDQNNRFLLFGQPAFLLGVYDSGLDYYATEAQYISQFTTSRRLFELPINLYYNYWFGATANQYMFPMFNVLQSRGIYSLTSTNCFQGTPIENMAQYWFLSASDSEVQNRSAQPGFAGFYTADECLGTLAPNVFAQYSRMKTLDPGGMTFAALNTEIGSSISVWRDAVDVLSMDPYPFYNGAPYNLSKVADYTKSTGDAVLRSRPFATVLQFFQGDSMSRWPTREELRNMSYMAVAEGANGLLYWELGQGMNALVQVCSGWCPEKTDYFERLKSVLWELKGLESALTTLDHPEMLVGNNNPSAVHTRVKYVNGQGYVIAYNYTNATVGATFAWNRPIANITVYNEGRTITPASASFSDSFGPYGAHVYIITMAP